MNQNLRVPTFRFEAESMRHSIITCIMERHEDLLRCVNAGIDAAMIELPITIARDAKQMSEDIMHSAFEKALTEYWETGNGRAMIDAQIEKKFKKLVVSA